MLSAIESNEENLSAARRAFNAYVNKYNTTIEIFPHSIIARMMNIKSIGLYEVPRSKREISGGLISYPFSIGINKKNLCILCW
ncbi:LemA family protein [Priestia filamentosa]|uniref:LemA family protein n=1 Tax=Priestia filamentosa TaxID=1402861 RepID=UPI0039821094